MAAEQVKHSHYKKDVSHLKVLDVYRIQELWTMHPCAEHVVKKMLVAGGRGHKDLDKDIEDCIDTLQRWQDMRKEDGKVIDAACNDEPGATLSAFPGNVTWSQVDERFEYISTDPSGGVWAFEKCPKWSHLTDCWVNGGGDSMKLNNVQAVDIQVAMNSLEQRPT